MGLKRRAVRPPIRRPVLSAEPLVGLKRPVGLVGQPEDSLSAEPLVGLKRRPLDRRGQLREPFSRTPRGFEAVSTTPSPARRSPFSRTPRGFEAIAISHSTRFPRTLSAEPLVGLKLVGFGRPAGAVGAFQPNPSWV